MGLDGGDSDTDDSLVLGILLANADISLVWATHETVASHFDNLANSSWIMTSFAIGYCVTLPLVGLPCSFLWLL